MSNATGVPSILPHLMLQKLLVLATFARLGATDMGAEEGAPTGLSPGSGTEPGIRESETGVRAGESLRKQREPGQGQDEGGPARKQRRLNGRGRVRA